MSSSCPPTSRQDCHKLFIRGRSCEHTSTQTLGIATSHEAAPSAPKRPQQTGQTCLHPSQSQGVASSSLTPAFSSSSMQRNTCQEFFCIEVELKPVVRFRLQEIHSGRQLELVERNCERTAKAVLSTSVAWHRKEFLVMIRDSFRIVTPLGTLHASGIPPPPPHHRRHPTTTTTTNNIIITGTTNAAPAATAPAPAPAPAAAAAATATATAAAAATTTTTSSW